MALNDRRACPQCGASSAAVNRFCGACGHDFGRTTSPVPARRSIPVGGVVRLAIFALAVVAFGGSALVLLSEQQNGGANQGSQSAAATDSSASPAAGDTFAAYQAFLAHVSAESGKLEAIDLTMATDASSSDAAAVQRDAQAMQAWANAEADWLDAHPALPCYAAAYILWDNVRSDAEVAAREALARDYTSAARDLTTIGTDATRAANGIKAISCP